MTTPIEYVEKIKSEFELIDFQPRNHTCESWNGLGNNMFGKACVTNEQRKKIVTSHITLLELLVEEEKKVITKYPENEYDEGLNNGRLEMVKRLEEIIKKLKEQI